MYRSEGRKLRNLGASGALAIGLIAGGVGIASATTSSTAASHTVAKTTAPPLVDGHHGQNGAHGVVSALSATSLTITNLDATTRTFSLTPATTVEKSGAPANMSDLAVGDRVDVRASDTTATVASDIEIDVPRVAGQVISVNGSTIVLSDAQGFYRTLSVDSSTVFTNAVGTPATLSNVVAGVFVMGEGSIAADHTTLEATAVVIGVPSGAPVGGPDGGPRGPGGDNGAHNNDGVGASGASFG